jgi:hypothetical protein
MLIQRILEQIMSKCLLLALALLAGCAGMYDRTYANAAGEPLPRDIDLTCRHRNMPIPVLMYYDVAGYEDCLASKGYMQTKVKGGDDGR